MIKPEDRAVLEKILLDNSEGEPNSGCIFWTRYTSRRGRYGYFTIAGKTWKAHRVAYELAFGPVPDGLNVLHRCDVPFCINELHLFPGTHIDNVSDRDQKGRTASGERLPISKLTASDVRAIRSRQNTDMSAKAFARLLGVEYGVNESTIRALLQGRTWKEI